MARKKRRPEESARREKIRELLQMANIDSMHSHTDAMRMDAKTKTKTKIKINLLVGKRKMGGLGGRRGKRIGVFHRNFVENPVEKRKTMWKTCGYVENRFSSPRRMPHAEGGDTNERTHQETAQGPGPHPGGVCFQDWDFRKCS